MDSDTDLFVQAFWVKCRETIRPELDRAIAALKDEGYEAHVSTQEYTADADQLPDAGPVLILSVHPKGSAAAATLRFRGDVTRKDVEVTGAGDSARRYELAALDEPTARREIADWLARVLGRRT
jgi:S1-C subfamily serine protease